MFNTNEKITNLITHSLNKVLDIKQGDLVSLNSGMLLSEYDSPRFERIREIQSGYPKSESTDSYLISVDLLIKETPFIFMGWAAYDEMWMPDYRFVHATGHLVRNQAQLSSIADRFFGKNDGGLVGMNIMLGKTMLLITDGPCDYQMIQSNPSEHAFFKEITACLRKH